MAIRCGKCFALVHTGVPNALITACAKCLQDEEVKSPPKETTPDLVIGEAMGLMTEIIEANVLLNRLPFAPATEVEIEEFQVVEERQLSLAERIGCVLQHLQSVEFGYKEIEKEVEDLRKKLHQYESAGPWRVGAVKRIEDMSPRGFLRVIVQDDGDVVVAVHEYRDEMVQPGSAAEFCAPYTGGGKSPHTWKALRELFDAMKRDIDDEVQKGITPNGEATPL